MESSCAAALVTKGGCDPLWAITLIDLSKHLLESSAYHIEVSQSLDYTDGNFTVLFDFCHSPNFLPLFLEYSIAIRK